MKTLRKGNEQNTLKILINSFNVEAYSKVHAGMIDDGIILRFGMYNLDDVLTQMLEDYGDEELIKRIKLIE